MSNVEREIVTFSCGIEAGVVVRPGQIIEIADPLRSGERRAGRITSATTNSVTVDTVFAKTQSGSDVNLSFEPNSTLSCVLPVSYTHLTLPTNSGV